MKKLISSYLAESRFRFLTFVFSAAIGVSFITRIILLLYSAESVDFTLLNLAGIVLMGFLYDAAFAFYLSIPFVLFLSFVPERFVSMNWFRHSSVIIFFMLNFILIFNAVAEFFFWEEFNTRFNFIAVDYLIYTTEVIGNIRQSYPITWIIFGIGISSFLITYLTRNTLTSRKCKVTGFGQRSVFLSAYMLFPVVSFFLVDSRMRDFSENQYVNELAGNGDFELFAAYRKNSLNYKQFYPRVSDSVAFNTVKREILEDTAHGAPFSADPKKSSKRLNVVLISVESLSAEFLAHFGNKDNITPFFDSLADRSILFTNLLATGTRTVRGLEALSLSVPPTPGQSIVRRPDNENLFTLASVLNKNGYESKFLYGGYGYFDNMNYFFANNGYKVIDRTALNDDEIDYENIWGVADENLFGLAIREIDKTIASGKLSFVHIMTTSNHRPYTYPPGRIDIPSHTGRKGAVKYTDYAVRSFFRKAGHKQWFKNTIFILTADHCASSAGKTELPVDKYRIPMLIFSPDHIVPAVERRLMSQIDVAPTVLGLLNVSYESKFYGHDIFHVKPGRERAFISTYQSLGFIKHDSMVILNPRRDPQILIDKGRGFEKINIDHPDRKKIVIDAISWYQLASDSFFSGGMKE